MFEDLWTQLGGRFPGTARSAPSTGPVAFGLACGAPLAVGQGVAWNDPAGSGADRSDPRGRLARVWGVRDAAGWRHAVDRLLAERGEGPYEVAMELRWQATVVRTVPPDLAGWQRIVHQSADEGRIARRGVPALLAAATRVSRYEDRFRADGLVPSLGVVHSVRAHDWGRAANLAAWGRRAGFADRAQSEDVLVRVGELCARHYTSWSDLSAAFGLGRVLSFDDEDFPVHYGEVREARRALLTQEGSPWRAMPWPALRTSVTGPG